AFRKSGSSPGTPTGSAPGSATGCPPTSLRTSSRSPRRSSKMSFASKTGTAAPGPRSHEPIADRRHRDGSHNDGHHLGTNDQADADFHSEAAEAFRRVRQVARRGRYPRPGGRDARGRAVAGRRGPRGGGNEEAQGDEREDVCR